MRFSATKHQFNDCGDPLCSLHCYYDLKESLHSDPRSFRCVRVADDERTDLFLFDHVAFATVSSLLPLLWR